MVTPMTKIEQSVGRILRQKHEFNPVVVDIIDAHANFQRQWLKRKTFYKSQNYKIIQTTSSAYTPDATKWKVAYEPTDQTPKKIDSKPCDISDPSDESDDEEEDSEESNKNVGKCLLKFKK
jgi:hypothetical protein